MNTFLKPTSTSRLFFYVIPKVRWLQYYLFTVDEPDPEEAINYGLNYTLVDLSLNNGFGDVVTSEENVPLITYNQSEPAESLLKCSEKITAVRMGNLEKPIPHCMLSTAKMMNYFLWQKPRLGSTNL